LTSFLSHLNFSPSSVSKQQALQNCLTTVICIYVAQIPSQPTPIPQQLLILKQQRQIRSKNTLCITSTEFKMASQLSYEPDDYVSPVHGFKPAFCCGDMALVNRIPFFQVDGPADPDRQRANRYDVEKVSQVRAYPTD
jgi:hypothetical protein